MQCVKLFGKKYFVLKYNKSYVKHLNYSWKHGNSKADSAEKLRRNLRLASEYTWEGFLPIIESILTILTKLIDHMSGIFPDLPVSDKELQGSEKEREIYNSRDISQYLEIGDFNYSTILLTIISIFSQNIIEFQKQVQTLESVYPLLISINTDKLIKKKLGCASYFQPACLYLEIRGRTLTRV